MTRVCAADHIAFIPTYQNGPPRVPDLAKSLLATIIVTLHAAAQYTGLGELKAPNTSSLAVDMEGTTSQKAISEGGMRSARTNGRSVFRLGPSSDNLDVANRDIISSHADVRYACYLSTFRENSAIEVLPSEPRLLMANFAPSCVGC